MKNNIVMSVLAVTFVVAGFGATAETAMAGKVELIEAMASHAGLSEEDSKKALEGILDDFVAEVGGALKKGNRISLIGFGSFSVSRGAVDEGDVYNVQFFPEGRETGAENRHQGEVVTGEQLVEKVAGKCGDEGEVEVCPQEVFLFLGSLLAVTQEALIAGESVEWGDLGMFETAIATSISKRSARTGRNPQTGKEIQIAAKNTVKFKAGAELSKAVN